MPPHLPRFPITLLLLVALTACSKREEGTVIDGRQAASGVAGIAAAKQLALAHDINIETAEDQVPVYFKLAQDACEQAAAEACTLLDTRISSGRNATASIKLRARPAGIRAVKAALSRKGEVVSQSTKAEDLAVPISDGSRKLKMLADYRGKLEALMGENLDADALIKLNRELAEVQSQLETATGSQAFLLQRVNTEILDVTVSSESRRSFGGPIREALQEFGPNLSRGIAGAISAIAMLLPFSLLLWGVVALVRKLRARIKRSRQSN